MISITKALWGVAPHALYEYFKNTRPARLRQQQEILRPAAPHDERSDHARLRGQQQRRARVADLQRLDVI